MKKYFLICLNLISANLSYCSQDYKDAVKEALELIKGAVKGEKTLGFLTEKNYPILSKTEVTGDNFFDMLKDPNLNRDKTMVFNIVRLLLDAIEQRIQPIVAPANIAQIEEYRKLFEDATLGFKDRESLRNKITQLQNLQGQKLPLKSLKIEDQDISLEQLSPLLEQVAKLVPNLDGAYAFDHADYSYLNKRIAELRKLADEKNK